MFLTSSAWFLLLLLLVPLIVWQLFRNAERSDHVQFDAKRGRASPQLATAIAGFHRSSDPGDG